MNMCSSGRPIPTGGGGREEGWVGSRVCRRSLLSRPFVGARGGGGWGWPASVREGEESRLRAPTSGGGSPGSIVWGREARGCSGVLCACRLEPVSGVGRHGVVGRLRGLRSKSSPFVSVLKCLVCRHRWGVPGSDTTGLEHQKCSVRGRFHPKEWCVCVRVCADVATCRRDGRDV